MAKAAAALLLGILLSLAVLEGGLRLLRRVFLDRQAARNETSLARDEDSYRVLCLGESTTALGGDDSWPSFLERLLNRAQLPRRVSVVNRGIPGTSTGYIVSQLPGWLARYRPQMVIAMVGINDGEGGNFQAGLTGPPARLRGRGFLSSRMLRAIWRTGRRWAGLTPETSGLYEPYTDEEPDADFFTTAIRGTCVSEDVLEWLEEAASERPDDDWLLVGLSRCHAGRGDVRRAQREVERALELNPKNEWALADLAKLMTAQGRPREAEAALRRLVASSPGGNLGHAGLKKLLFSQGRQAEVRVLFERLVAQRPDDAMARRRLSALYRELGLPELAERELARARELGRGSYSASTRHNLNRLRKLVVDAGARLVLVQYPMRELAPLQALIDEPQGVIFVDNEPAFGQVVRAGNTRQVFSDMFAGDFGHLTPMGSRLLATTVAGRVLHDVFGTALPPPGPPARRP